MAITFIPATRETIYSVENLQVLLNFYQLHIGAEVTYKQVKNEDDIVQILHEKQLLETVGDSTDDMPFDRVQITQRGKVFVEHLLTLELPHKVWSMDNTPS